MGASHCRTFTDWPDWLGTLFDAAGIKSEESTARRPACCSHGAAEALRTTALTPPGWFAGQKGPPLCPAHTARGGLSFLGHPQTMSTLPSLWSSRIFPEFPGISRTTLPSLRGVWQARCKNRAILHTQAVQSASYLWTSKQADFYNAQSAETCPYPYPCRSVTFGISERDSSSCLRFACVSSWWERAFLRSDHTT